MKAAVIDCNVGMNTETQDIMGFSGHVEHQVVTKRTFHATLRLALFPEIGDSVTGEAPIDALVYSQVDGSMPVERFGKVVILKDNYWKHQGAVSIIEQAKKDGCTFFVQMEHDQV